MPRQYSATGKGMHREGFVVEFRLDASRSWVGNFQPGLTTLNDVLIDESAHVALVIAGGQGYRVRLHDGELLSEIGGTIQSVYASLGIDGLVFCDGTDFELHRDTLVWRTRRVSWDGFRNVKMGVKQLTGEAWMFDDTWHPFSVNLATGEVEGGSYYEA
jgi:hypothetical protein